ncbi:MAG: excinuclease ABC subunit UvrC, partial [Desulfobacterales bacterium]
AAESQDFERAARLRDKMFSLEKTIEKQIAVTTDFMDRDALALARADDFTVMTMLTVRGGFLRGTQNFEFSQTMSTQKEAVGSFIRQYYEKNHFIPKEILIAQTLEDTALIEDWLGNLKGGKVRILRPQRGEKVRLINMAVHNAENELKNLMASRTAHADVLARLQKKLQIRRIPRRIECFDNSNIAGKEPVAGMVVFENGKAQKSLYRRYRIKAARKQDDYAYMAEVLRRRFGKGEISKPYPDLLMVDGGKGQLNIALAVMLALGVAHAFDIIGIAKQDEKKGETQDKIFRPGRSNPLNFARERDLLLFLQRIRDEAHRFAVSFHRQRRSRSSLQSALDNIPGVGPTRKMILLKHFKSISKIRAARLEELSRLPGFNRRVAEAVHRALAE